MVLFYQKEVVVEGEQSQPEKVVASPQPNKKRFEDQDQSGPPTMMGKRASHIETKREAHI